MLGNSPTDEVTLNLRAWLKAKFVDYVLRFTHSIVPSGGIAGSAFMRRREVNGPAPSRWIGSLDYPVLETLVFQFHEQGVLIVCPFP
jgi:hypothetical protein